MFAVNRVLASPGILQSENALRADFRERDLSDSIIIASPVFFIAG